MVKTNPQNDCSVKLRVGVIGAGAISDIYLSNMINRFDNLEVVCVAARHIERAKVKAEKYGIMACTTDELLKDKSIDMVVVLTPVGTHYELIKAALLAGKHVYTEKTMTDDPAKAKELLDIANEKGLYLGAAPDTFLGGAWQNARAAVDKGLLGEIHSFVISGNRDNDVLTGMFPFLREKGAGILYDYCVYYMTTLVSILGSVAEVSGMLQTPYTKRVGIIKDTPDFGKEYETPNESEVAAVIRLENGITGTLHVDAESNASDRSFYAIYGTKGILYLTDPNGFGGDILFYPNPKNWDEVVPEKIDIYKDFCDNSRGIGPSEMADAIINKRPCRPSKEMAYHVLEILAGIMESNEKHEFVKIESTCERPEARSI